MLSWNNKLCKIVTMKKSCFCVALKIKKILVESQQRRRTTEKKDPKIIQEFTENKNKNAKNKKYFSPHEEKIFSATLK
jgi:hypothetical protein